MPLAKPCGRTSYSEVTPQCSQAALAEPRQHRKVGLLPGVVFRYVMPAYAGDGGALRRTWEAARAGGARLTIRLHLEMQMGVLLRRERPPVL